MASIGYATLSIVPSMRGIQRGIERELAGASGPAGQVFAGGMSKGFMSRVGGLGGAVVKTVAKGAAAAGGIGGAIFGAASLGKGFNRLTTIENATKSLEITLGSASKAGDFLNGVLDAVRGTPFNLDQFANAGKNLVAFGVGAEKVPGYLTAIGESAAASGKGAEAVDRVVDAFGKMAAQGKVSLDQVWSISDTGVPALQILANEFGVTTKEMQKLISAGAVPAERAMDALAKGIVDGSNGAAGSTVAFRGSMEGLRTTLTGALGGFQAATARYGAAILAPFSPGAVKVLTSAADLVDAVGERAAGVAQRLADTGVLERFAASLERVPGVLDRIALGAGAAFAFLARGEYTRPLLDLFGIEAGSSLLISLQGARESVGTLYTGAKALFDLIVRGDYTAPLMELLGIEAGSKTVMALTSVRDFFTQTDWLGVARSATGVVADLVGGLDPDKVSRFFGAFSGDGGGKSVEALKSIGASMKQLTPAFAAAAEQLPKVSDVLTVTAGVFGFLADHVDTIVKLMPLLVGAFIAVKVAQAASNVATAAGVPLRALEIASRAQHTAALRANSAAIAGNTVGTSANTAATSTGMVTRLRSTAALVGQRIASLATTAATAALTAGQWLLNAAMRANPFGLLVVGLGLLVGAIVYAYKNSETFRNIVNGAWAAIRIGAGIAWAFLRDKVLIPLGLKVVEAWKTFQLLRTNLDVVWAAIKQTVRDSTADVVDKFLGMVGTVIQGAADAFSWVPGLGDKLQTAADDFETFRGRVNQSIRGIDAERTVSIRAELNATADALVKAGADPAAAAKRVRNIGLATGGPVVGAGTGTSDSVVALGPEGMPNYRLSDGEYIQNAAAVKHYGSGVMAALNARAIPKDALVRRAKGGPVASRGVSVATDFGGTDDMTALAGRLNAGAGALMQSMSGYVSGLQTAAKQAAAARAAAADVGGAMGPIPRGDGWVRPIRGGRVTSEYGPRGGRMHSGIDVSTGGGATIYAARAGRVKARKYHSSWGNHVQIQHDTGMTNYAHMVRPGIVSPGQLVKAGQAIGTEGNTGNSFGAHLHFEWSPNGSGRVNPRRLGLFDKGGIARGKGWMPKGVIAPERTLDPRQTVAFERLVNVLDRSPVVGPVATATADGTRPLSVDVYVEAAPGTREWVRGEARVVVREDKRSTSIERSYRTRDGVGAR